MTKTANKATAITKLIADEARAQGVPIKLALAIAWAESRFDPSAEGDLRWHENEDRFERVVPRDNPFRAQRSLWHSYGLFQLLAPYHVHASESPTVLLDPNVNAARGIATIKRLLRQHNGDWNAVRLAYTGATQASPEVQSAILAKLARAVDHVEKAGLA